MGEAVFGHNFAFDQVPLDDLLEDVRGAGVVPGSFRINESDGTAGADLKAVCFRAVDALFALSEPETAA